MAALAKAMARTRSKNKVYLVEVSRGDVREFTDWPSCQAFVHGQPYAYAGGPDRDAAMAKLSRSRGAQQRHREQGRSGDRAGAASASKRASSSSRAQGDRPTAGICADAGTHGNPGPCEYQVCDLSGTTLAHAHLGVHSNNYAELAGIAAMIEYALAHEHRVLWTDSQIAMGWIDTGRVGPTVHEREQVIAMAKAIKAKLRAHPQLELRKWHTKTWGEIPADFGRK